MTEDQKKRMHPGAYKSCLIPYAERSFHGGTMSNFRQQKFKEGRIRQG